MRGVKYFLVIEIRIVAKFPCKGWEEGLFSHRLVAFSNMNNPEQLPSQ